MKKLLSVISLCLILLLCACDISAPAISDDPGLTIVTATPGNGDPATPVPGKYAGDALQVFFLDVGQADSALLLCDGHAMLIDGGNVDDGKDVAAFLAEKGVKALDVIVATHAHEDHIGGLSKVIKATDTVSRIVVPDAKATGECFRIFKEAADKKCGLTEVRAGEEWTLGQAAVRVLAPVDPLEKDLNDTSIVLKVTLGGISYLFCGDAGKTVESGILSRGENVSAQVIKIGHHGSSDASGYYFVRQVMPQLGIISCALTNDYGHPHEETVARYGQADVELLRTYELGTFEVSTDGALLAVRYGAAERIVTPDGRKPALDEFLYIGNKNSKIFHVPDCEGLPGERNRVEFSSRAEAEAAGYRACPSCRP